MSYNAMRLIITDNKVMADTIAQAFDYTEEDAGAFGYLNEDTQIIWTGGDLIHLSLKDKITKDTDLSHLSAEEITTKCYHATPRTIRGLMANIDKERIAAIEEALSYNEEVFFMCEPTVEGEKVAQSIKLYFGLDNQAQSIVLDEFTPQTVQEAIEFGMYSMRIEEYRSRMFMAQAVHNDLNTRDEQPVAGVDPITPDALSLYDAIKESYYMERFSFHCIDDKEDKERKAVIGGALDINRLYAAMDAKYGMVMWSLWDSLLYLYAKGMISNPMTHLQRELDPNVYFGMGYADDTVITCGTETYLKRIGAIRQIGEIDEYLLSESYDAKTQLDDFVPRTAAVYRFIVEQHRNIDKGLELETITYPPYAENDGYPITEIMKLRSICFGDTHSYSVTHSLGWLIESLYIGELAQPSNAGLTKILDID